MIKRYFSMFCGIVFLCAYNSAAQLPCTDEKADPSNPSAYIGEVLDSFPEDQTVRYLGAFRDKGWHYELQLYKDARGIFGELLSPVREADSSSARLDEVVFDSKKGLLRFNARFSYLQVKFSGVWRGAMIEATTVEGAYRKKYLLKKVRDSHGGGGYTSRAQFDCAMKLFNRN